MGMCWEHNTNYLFVFQFQIIKEIESGIPRRAGHKMSNEEKWDVEEGKKLHIYTPQNSVFFFHLLFVVTISQDCGKILILLNYVR